MESLRQSHVCAGIVTYNPDEDRLRQNVAAIGDQVDHLFIFDNGSENAQAVSEIAELTIVPTTVHRAPYNMGIATALDDLLQAAENSGYELLLTLDQDSVASAGMVEDLKREMLEGVALVGPRIVDRNKPSLHTRATHARPVQTYTSPARRGAITSGALVRVSAAREVGGFDGDLFIDYVDYDLNARLMLAGWRILCVEGTELLHEVGRARATWLRVPRKSIDGHWAIERFYSFGHSEFRCFYKARNRVIFSRRYGLRFGLRNEGILQIPQQVMLTLVFEDDRWRKLCAFVRGTLAGIRMDRNAVRRFDANLLKSGGRMQSASGHGGSLWSSRRRAP